MSALTHKLASDVVVEVVGFEYLVLHKSTGAVQRLEGRSAVALREVMSGRDPHLMGLGDVLEILVDLRIVEPATGRVSRRKMLGLAAAAAGVGIVTITMPQAVAASSTEDDDISGLVAPSGFVTSTSGILINGQEAVGGIGLAINDSLTTDGYFYRSAAMTNFPGSFQARLTVVGGSGGAGGGANGGVAGRGGIVIAVVNVSNQYANDVLHIHVGGAGQSGSAGPYGGGARIGAPSGSGASGAMSLPAGGTGAGSGGAASMVSRPTFPTPEDGPLLVIAGGGGGGGRGSSESPGGYGGHSGRNGSPGENGAPDGTFTSGAGGGGGGLQSGTPGAVGSPDAYSHPAYSSFGFSISKAATPGAGRSGDPTFQLGAGDGGMGGEAFTMAGGGGSGYAGGGGGGSGMSAGAGGGGGSSWASDGSASFGLRGTTGNGYVRVQLKSLGF